MKCDNTAIVDFQAFYNNKNDYIVKELAVLNCKNGETILHIFFKAPFPFEFLTEKYRRTNNYCSYNLHGIFWTYGNEPYCNLQKMMDKCLIGYNSIICKGVEKCRFLEKYTQLHVLEYDEISTRPLGNENDIFHCKSHIGKSALSKAKQIFNSISTEGFL